MTNLLPDSSDLPEKEEKIVTLREISNHFIQPLNHLQKRTSWFSGDDNSMWTFGPKSNAPK